MRRARCLNGIRRSAGKAPRVVLSQLSATLRTLDPRNFQGYLHLPSLQDRSSGLASELVESRFDLSLNLVDTGSGIKSIAWAGRMLGLSVNCFDNINVGGVEYIEGTSQ